MGDRKHVELNWGWLQLFTYGHEGWFRLFGRGIGFVDHRIHRPLFSEREGYQKVLHVGPFCFRYLRRRPRP
jgi:hypothetical protein